MTEKIPNQEGNTLSPSEKEARTLTEELMALDLEHITPGTAVAACDAVGKHMNVIQHLGSVTLGLGLTGRLVEGAIQMQQVVTGHMEHLHPFESDSESINTLLQQINTGSGPAIAAGLLLLIVGTMSRLSKKINN